MLTWQGSSRERVFKMIPEEMYSLYRCNDHKCKRWSLTNKGIRESSVIFCHLKLFLEKLRKSCSISLMNRFWFWSCYGENNHSFQGKPICFSKETRNSYSRNFLCYLYLSKTGGSCPYIRISMHSDSLTAPGCVKERTNGHLRQVVLLSSGWNVPSGHCKHVPFSAP